MSVTAILLVLVAALTHAVWNLSAKRAGAAGALFVWGYCAVATVVCAPVAVVTLLASGAQPSWSWLYAAAVSAVLHVGYYLALQRGYAVGDMSVVYPVARGTGPLLSVLAAVLLLGEHPGVLGLAGAAAVVLGVLVISAGRASAAKGTSARVSLAYGLVTGVGIAVYTLWDAHSVNAMGVPPLIYLVVGMAMETAILSPNAVANRGRLAALWREHRVDLLVVGVLSPLAYLLVLFAMRIAPVSLVAPARESSIVVGSLIAWLVLGESNPLRRMIGSVIVLTGIVAIAVA
ncbi:EamA family transporter [Solihabitans fulvus]|uniref:EamA family transporter n=1 Tax=Solihabitans fulvus TaxID=1892852 RepID=A0A5B2XTF2_9PSEU|nr:DMT family transporter [Solihabitans fulvus]KAA2266111.1 EamA family transporter [Solihabitans fulvus]